MDLTDSLTQLAQQNFSGVAFLGAYGLTWLICGLGWTRVAVSGAGAKRLEISERTAAFVTLFQGLVAFPLAMGASLLLGAIGNERPVSDEITQLSVLIGTSQLLGLPFLIYLVVKRAYAIVPFAFAAITSMHFVLYSWLYRTPIYIAMAILIALGTLIVMLSTPKEPTGTAPARVCFLTGGLLAVTAGVVLVIHPILAE